MPDVARRARLSLEIARLARFALVGVANTLLGGGLIVASELVLGLNPFVANIVGFSAGTAVSFLLNKGFVFEVVGGRGALQRFVAALAIAFCANQSILALGRGLLEGGGGRSALVQLAAMLAYTAVNFLLCRFWVFAAQRGPQAATAP